MPKKNQVDFFGMKRTPNYLNGKSNASFLGPGRISPNSKKNGPKINKGKSNSKVKPINFLNGGKPMYPINNSRPKGKYMNWNYQQIKKKFPGINPYGDADMDGSMNYKDCKPFDASKDGLLSVLKGAFSKKDKPFRVETKEERTLREVGAKIKAVKRKQRTKAFVSGSSDPRPLRKLLTRKVKGKIVIRKPIVAEQAVKGAVILAGVPAVFPKKKTKGKSRKGESVRASAGRPKGSYKFTIPGRGPVPIHVYKKWLSEQKAKARIKALAHVQAIQTGESPPINGDEFEAEPSQEVPPQQFEEVAPVQVVQQRAQQQFQQAQVLSQTPRHAPQQLPAQGVPRENLDFSRRGILTPQGGSILSAPNIARGELRGVGEVSVVTLGDRPQTNPRGELFTQIDPVTGRSIVHRRISEKFATGEAL